MTLAPSLTRPIPPVLFSRDADRIDLRTRVAAGELERVRRGAYAQVPPEDGPDGGRTRRALNRIYAVHAQTTTPHWFSHESAALLWGCWAQLGDDATHLIQTIAPCGERDRSVRRRTPTLPPRERTAVGGLPVTTLERTVVDVACLSRSDHALAVVDSALRLGASRAEIGRIASSRTGGRGIARARIVLRATNPLSESPGESILRWITLDESLPVFTPQLEVQTRGGRFRVDLGLARARLALEFDGAVKYSGLFGLPSTTIADQERRERLLRGEGWTVLRFVWSDLYDRDAVVAKINHAVVAAR